MRDNNHRDLVAACLWASVTVAAVAASDSAVVRTILGAPMVFLISGHAVLRAIGVRTTSLPEHLVYTVGVSVAACIVGGFALHAVGCLTPLGWAVWLWGVTGATSLVAASHCEVPGLPPWPGLPNVRLWPHGATIVVAVMIVFGAYALAVWDEAHQRQFRYTEFWMLPGASGDPARLVVGVRSAEAKPQRFDMEISLDGSTLAAFHSLAIEPGETWTREIAVPVRTSRQKAEARLYRTEDKLVYRKVSAVVPGAA